VARGHLAELDHALRRMDLHRRVPRLRRLDARLQQRLRAGIDLGRCQHAEEAPALVPRGGIDHAQRLRHGLAPGRLVPLVLDAMAVAGEPAGRAIGGRKTGADAAAGEILGPVGARRGIIHEGGDATLQHLRHREERRGAARVLVGAHQQHELVERAHAELGRAALLHQAAVEGLARGVRMDVDQARHHHVAAAADLPVGAPGVAPPHEVEAIAGEGDVGVAEVLVPSGCLVPRDHPIRILDDGRAHGMPRDRCCIGSAMLHQSAPRASPDRERNP